MGEIGADDAAVADHQHLPAIGMRAGDLDHGPDHASLHVRKRLASRRQTGDGIPHPPGVRIARQGADLLDRPPLPLAETKLAQILDRSDRHFGPGRGDLGRAPGPLKGAGEDSIEGQSIEPRAEGAGIGVALGREGEIGDASVLA